MTQAAGRPRTTVVVGVDGSEHSRRALEWAAAEARRRGAPLRIVHAFPFELPRSGGSDPYVDAASQSLRDVAAHVRLADHGPPAVSTDVVDGLPSKVLVEESRQSALVVLGGRGHGGFARLLLGSTAVDVTARAHCPVAVVPAGENVSTRPGDVVVGVDASAGDEAALEFAFTRASRRRAGLVALYVWQPPSAYGSYAPADPSSTDTERLQTESEALLARALAPWQERFPGVAVNGRVVRGQVVAELAQASETEGEVVVVGARGRSVLAGTVLGSVSQGLLHHAAGPIVVVR